MRKVHFTDIRYEMRVVTIESRPRNECTAAVAEHFERLTREMIGAMAVPRRFMGPDRPLGAVKLYGVHDRMP